MCDLKIGTAGPAVTVRSACTMTTRITASRVMNPFAMSASARVARAIPRLVVVAWTPVQFVKTRPANPVLNTATNVKRPAAWHVSTMTFVQPV